jgi:hypothetical protein
MYYSMSYSAFETRIVETQLEEVVNYISSNAIDLVSLCSLSNLDQLIMEELEVPERVNTNYYNITIERVKDPNTKEWLFTVRAHLNSQPTILKESNLPWSAEGNLRVYNGTDPLGITDSTLQPELIVSSNSANIVVWCLKNGEKTTIGLGLKD